MARTGSTVGCRFGIILCIFVAFLVSEIGGRRLLHGLEKLMTACAGYDGFCLVIEFTKSSGSTPKTENAFRKDVMKTSRQVTQSYVLPSGRRTCHSPWTRSDTKEFSSTLPVVITDRDNLNPNQTFPFGIHP